MKTQDTSKSFAFKLAAGAQKKEDKKAAWQVRDAVAVAGCSGPDARASGFFGRDTGVYC